MKQRYNNLSIFQYILFIRQGSGVENGLNGLK